MNSHPCVSGPQGAPQPQHVAPRQPSPAHLNAAVSAVHTRPDRRDSMDTTACLFICRAWDHQIKVAPGTAGDAVGSQQWQTYAGVSGTVRAAQ